MARNNKTINFFKTQNDLLNRAKKLQHSIDKNKKERTIDDIYNIAEYLNNGTDIVLQSNINTIPNKNKSFSFTKPKADNSTVIKALETISKINFFEIVSGKKESSQDTMIKAINISEKIKIKNQEGKSNESLSDSIDKMKMFLDYNNQNNEDASFFVYDLETIGGKDLNGIWKPTHITEYSMHEYSANNPNKKAIKTDIVIGLDEKEGEDLLTKIRNAINDGSINYNEELRVTAGRLSLYGDKRTRIEMTDKGYFTVKSFIDSDEGSYKDLKRIETGINELVRVRRETKHYNGVPLDIYNMMKSLKDTNEALKGRAMILGYNSSNFDSPIINAIGNKYLNQYPQLKELFGEEGFSFLTSGNKHFDIRGLISNFKNHLSTKMLLPGYDLSKIGEKINKQEVIAKAILGEEAFNNLGPAHVASTDVTALFKMISDKNTGMFKINNKDVNLIEYAYDLLKPFNQTESINLNSNLVFQAIDKPSSYTGKNVLNFAIDSDNKVYTSGNAIIDNNNVTLKNFNTGADLNKDSFYNISSVDKIIVDDTFLNAVSDVMPQYGSKEMYAVKINRVLPDKYKHTKKVGDLTNVILLNSEDEVNAFIANNMKLVGEINGNDYKIFDEDAFDIREYKFINNQPNFISKKTNKKLNKEIMEEAFEFQANKILTSRAENWANGSNSLSNIKKILNVSKEFNKTTNQQLHSRQLEQLMSLRIASNKLPFSIDENTRQQLVNSINNIIKNQFTGEVLNSSIDNVSTYIDVINDSKDYYELLINTIDSKLKDSPPDIKQEYFSRIDRLLKEDLAREIFNNDIDIKKSILLDNNLKTSMKKYKNMFELDLSKIEGNKRVNYIDVTQSNPGNLLRLDLTNTNNLEYKIVNNVREAIYGKNIEASEGLNKKAMRQFYKSILKDESFNSKLSISGYTGDKIKDKIYTLKDELIDISNGKDFNVIETTSRFIKALKDIKKDDITAGIISQELFMKDLNSNKGFAIELNKLANEKMVSKINNYINNIDLVSINGSKERARSFVDEKLIDMFVQPTDIEDNLYKTVKKDVSNYLTDLIYTIDKSNASISFSNNNLAFYADGEMFNLNLPKVKQDFDSKVWYIETGNMKNQLKYKLKINNKNNKVDMSVITNLGYHLNNYPISRTVEKVYKKDGQKEALNSIVQNVNNVKKKIIAGSTINNNNGNDIYSNRLVDLNDFSNIVESLFSKDGKLNYLIKDKKFLDKNLQTVMEQYVSRYVNNNNPIEELDSNMIKELSKNIRHILEIVADNTNASPEVKELIKNISMSGSVKQTSNMVGVVGNSPYAAINSIMDDTKRPPVLQALNAIPIRKNDIQKAGYMAGNLFTSNAIEKETSRIVSGIGETTTDVMMDIAYLDVEALSVIKNSHFNKVINNNNVNQKQKDIAIKALEMMSKMNTYEQERHMNSIVFEKIYGINSAQVQNISNSKDYVSVLGLLDSKEAERQLDFLLSHRGVIQIQDDKLVFNSAIGTPVKRGERLIATLGFNDKVEYFSPKVKNGVFLHQYIKSNGMILRDDEITKIINSNKDLFLNKDGSVKPLENTSKILDELLEKEYSAVGMFRVEDINLIGKVKPTTAAAEKGMTGLNYVKTGAINKDVRNLFEELNLYNTVRGSTLTDNAVKAYLKNVNKEVLNKYNFNSVEDVINALKDERHSVNKYIYENIFNNKIDMVVNDNVIKHNGAGQIQFGKLNKAIFNLIEKNNKDVEKTLKQIKSIIDADENLQFLSELNLKSSSINNKKLNIKDNRFFFENLESNADNAIISDVTKLDSLIAKINDLSGITSDKVKIEDSDVFISKEVVKLLPDVETQSGTDAEYFSLKEQIKELKLQKELTDNMSLKMELSEKISALENRAKDIETVSKRMKIGKTEVQLLERIRITDKHAQKIEDLINKGELSDEILATQAFKGRVIRDVDNKIKIDEAFKGRGAVDEWINDFKSLISYNPLEEDLLNYNDVLKKEYAHLKPLLDKANEMKIDLGKDSAEKIYKLGQAKKAINFNNDKNLKSIEYMLNNGFEMYNIQDINWDADEIAKKDLLIDLGEKFSENRYIAIAGTGHIINVNDEEEEILTNGQKQLRALAHKYEDWKYGIGTPEEYKNKEEVYKQINKTKKAIRDSIYGKNAYSDKISQVLVSTPNYRLKAFGVVVPENDLNLMREAVEKGMNIDEVGKFGNLNIAEINGKTLAQHHLEGANYDYKFVSLETMDKMGMFSTETMKLYGAKNQEEMIEILKRYGTMDITDRYPNNKNDSMLLTHVFLDETLQGNETKVAGHSGLKMLLDHDGDSVSSFLLRKEKQDYGSFLAARRKVLSEIGENASEEAIIEEMNKRGISNNMYQAFKDMEAITTTRAYTENRAWANEVKSILKKDKMRNASDISDLNNTVTVKDGQSILGRISVGSFTGAGSYKQALENETNVNALIADAGAIYNKLDKQTIEELNNAKIPITKKDLFDINMGVETNKIITSDNSSVLLDKALTVLEKGKEQGLIDDLAFNKYQSEAIMRIGIDKASIASLSKTGTAATGNINIATTSIKNAAHDMLINYNPEKADMIRSVLDIPEQAAISSKKIKSAYDDNRAFDFINILDTMIKDSKYNPSSVFDSQHLNNLKDWFMNNAKDDLANIYDKSSYYYLDKKNIDTMNMKIANIMQRNISSDEKDSLIKTLKANKILDNTFSDLQKLSTDEMFHQKRDFYKNRGGIEDLSIATSQKNNFSNIPYQLLNEDNEEYLNIQKELKMQTEEAVKRKQHFNNIDDIATPKMQKSMISNISDKLFTHTPKAKNGLGLAMLGFAGGLLATGYSTGNPLNDKQASEVAQETKRETMSIPEFMDNQGGYVTGNTQQGYIINIKADTKKGRKHMERIMKQAAQASVGGAVSINMNIKNMSNRGITDSDIENFLEKYI